MIVILKDTSIGMHWQFNRIIEMQSIKVKNIKTKNFFLNFQKRYTLKLFKMRVQNTSTFHLPLFHFLPSFCILSAACYGTQLSFLLRPSLTFFTISIREVFFGSFNAHFLHPFHA